MATADSKKKKKKRKKKESLEHKRTRILVALGIFAVVYALDEARHPRRRIGTPATSTPALCCSSCHFDCRLRRTAKGIQ